MDRPHCRNAKNTAISTRAVLLSSSSSTAMSCLFDDDDFHRKYGIDVEYLTQEEVVKYKQSFWNVAQCQTDRLYCFYYKQEDSMVQRASHLRRVILGKENLVDSTAAGAGVGDRGAISSNNGGEDGTRTFRGTSNFSNVQEEEIKTKPFSSTTTTSSSTTQKSEITQACQVLEDVIDMSENLLEDINSLKKFLATSKKNYMKVLEVLDNYHGTNVKDIELAALEETHTFLDGSRLKVLTDLILEDVINEAEKKLIDFRLGQAVAQHQSTANGSGDGIDKDKISPAILSTAQTVLGTGNHHEEVVDSSSNKTRMSQYGTNLEKKSDTGCDSSNEDAQRDQRKFAWCRQLINKCKVKTRRKPLENHDKQHGECSDSWSTSTWWKKSSRPRQTKDKNTMTLSSVEDKDTADEQCTSISGASTSLKNSLVSIFQSRLDEKEQKAPCK